MHPPVNVMFTYLIYEKNEKQCGILQIGQNEVSSGNCRGIEGVLRTDYFFEEAVIRGQKRTKTDKHPMCGRVMATVISEKMRNKTDIDKRKDTGEKRRER